MKIRAEVTRVVIALLCTVATAAGLSGCRHRPIVAQVLADPQLQAPSPPPLQTISSPMTAKLPDSVVSEPQSVVTEEKLKPVPRKAASRTPTEEPTDLAAAEREPDVSAVGELYAGGVSRAETQQAAADLISGSERRLNSLPKAVEKQQQAQIRQVRYFLRQAAQALKTGDAEGAKTLATKAKLLLDDLEKPG